MGLKIAGANKPSVLTPRSNVCLHHILLLSRFSPAFLVSRVSLVTLVLPNEHRIVHNGDDLRCAVGEQLNEVCVWAMAYDFRSGFMLGVER